jgi:hypothetical protein
MKHYRPGKPTLLYRRFEARRPKFWEQSVGDRWGLFGAALLAMVVFFPGSFGTMVPGPSTSATDANVVCILGGDTRTQLTHEYSSCVSVLEDSPVWRSWN